MYYSYMDDSELKELREKLIKLKDELDSLSQTSKDATKTVELDQASVGRLSRMDAIQAQQMAKELAHRRQRQIDSIDGALRRIETGDYGYCFICGEEIESRRIETDPTITRCLKCAD